MSIQLQRLLRRTKEHAFETACRNFDSMYTDVRFLLVNFKPEKSLW